MYINSWLEVSIGARVIQDTYNEILYLNTFFNQK